MSSSTNQPLDPNLVIDPFTTTSLTGPDNTTGIYLDADPANSSVLIKTNNTPAAYFDKYQNLGINTLSPSAQLDVNSPSGSCIQLTYNNSPSHKAKLGVSSDGKLLLSSGGAEIIVDTTSSLNVKSHNSTTSGLMLNNALVRATADQINYNIVTPGTAAPSKSVVLNSSSSVTGINALSATTLTGTLQTPEQPNVTSVTTVDVTGHNGIAGLALAGRLVNASADELNYVHTTPGAVQASKAVIVDSARSIINLNEVTATKVTGTVQTAAQPNITSVGTLQALDLAGPLTGLTDLSINTTETGRSLVINSKDGNSVRMYYDADTSKVNYADLLVNSAGHLMLTSSGGNVDVTAHNGSSVGLKLGGVLVKATADQINYLEGTTAGFVSEGKALIADTNRNLTNVNALTAATITGTLQTFAQPNISSVNALDITTHNGITAGLKLNGTLVTATAAKLNYVDTTPGTAAASKALVVSVDRDIANIHSLTAEALTGTLETAAQPQVTSVGTLTSLDVAGDVTVGATVISETDIAKIGAITDGTAAAHKALVVDANKDVAGIRNLSAANLTGTLQTSFQPNIESVEVLDVTLHDGEQGLALGGHIVTATAAELNYVDTTPGTAQASKAVVLNATKDVAGINALSATSLTGTIQTAAQPKITSVGHLDSLFVKGDLECDGNLIVGGTIISESEIVHLDGATPGASQALKAIVTDDQNSIGAINTLSATNLTSTAGKLTMGATSISESEIGVLDAVVPGTVAASKAVVVDANKDISSFRNLTATNLTGTLQTAAQPNISSVSVLDVAGHDGTTQGLKLGGQLLTATASQLNSIFGGGSSGSASFGSATVSGSLTISNADGSTKGLVLGSTLVTSSADELNYIDGSTPGTVVASKAVVVDANKSITGMNSVGASFLQLTGTTPSEILTSPVILSTGGTGGYPLQMAYSSTLNSFVIGLDQSSTAIVSTDGGLTFTRANLPVTANWVGCVWDSKSAKFLLFGAGNNVAVSSNGTAWSSAASMTNSARGYGMKSFGGGGVALAFPNGNYTFSNNGGQSWTDYTIANGISMARNVGNSAGINEISSISAAVILWKSTTSQISGYYATTLTTMTAFSITFPTTIEATTSFAMAYSTKLDRVVILTPSTTGTTSRFAYMDSPTTTKLSANANWTFVNAPMVGNWVECKWVDSLNVFVAIGNNNTNKIIYSRDGITWSVSGVALPTYNSGTSFEFTSKSLMIAADYSSGVWQLTSVAPAASITINNTTINETKLATIDVTPGAAIAGKALVVDSARSVSNINALSATTLTLGSTTIDETEIGRLDGVTAGTGAANKALVLDASKNISGVNSLMLGTSTDSSRLISALSNATENYFCLGNSNSAGNQMEFKFQYNGSNAATNYASFGIHTLGPIFTMTNQSYVGIGTTTPATKLDVTGSFRATGQSLLTAGTVSTSTTSGTLVVTGGMGVSGAVNAATLSATTLTLGATTISESEVGVLDAVVPGAAGASKALVLNSSKAIVGLDSLETREIKIRGVTPGDYMAGGLRTTAIDGTTLFMEGAVTGSATNNATLGAYSSTLNLALKMSTSYGKRTYGLITDPTKGISSRVTFWGSTNIYVKGLVWFPAIAKFVIVYADASGSALTYSKTSSDGTTWSSTGVPLNGSLTVDYSGTSLEYNEVSNTIGLMASNVLYWTTDAQTWNQTTLTGSISADNNVIGNSLVSFGNYFLSSKTCTTAHCAASWNGSAWVNVPGLTANTFRNCSYAAGEDRLYVFYDTSISADVALPFKTLSRASTLNPTTWVASLTNKSLVCTYGFENGTFNSNPNYGIMITGNRANASENWTTISIVQVKNEAKAYEYVLPAGSKILSSPTTTPIFFGSVFTYIAPHQSDAGYTGTVSSIYSVPVLSTPGGYLTFGSIAINEAEISVLDAVAPGAASASKALVLDASKNITGINAISASTLTLGATTINESEVNVLDAVVPGAAAASKAVVLDLSKNVTGINALTATTLTLGATTITESEIGVLDAVVPGAAAASKALIINADKSISGIKSIKSNMLTLTPSGFGFASFSQLFNNWNPASIAYSPTLDVQIATNNPGASGTTAYYYRTSTTDWVQKTTLPLMNTCACVWMPNVNKFVVIGNDGNTSAYSSDGVSWTSSSFPITNVFRALYVPSYGGVFCLSYNGSSFAFSSNGMTWTQYSTTASLGSFIVSFSDLGNNIVIVPVGYTTNSITFNYLSTGTAAAPSTWTLTFPTNGNTSGRCAAAYSPTLDRCVIVTNSNSTLVNAFAYKDGVRSNNFTTGWTFVNAPIAGGWNVCTWVSELSMFVATGYNDGAASNMIISNDGITWTVVPSYGSSGMKDPLSMTYVSNTSTIYVNGNTTQSVYGLASASSPAALTLNATTIFENEIAVVDSVTPGTAAASKALVLDSSKNITGINALVATDLTATTLTLGTTSISESEIGVLDAAIPGTAAANKALVLNSSSNVAGINALTASGLTATTLTLGTTSIIESELGVLDAATPGAALASKAVVLDSSSSVMGINSLAATSLTGTLQTAAQPEITSVGTLTSLAVAGDVTVGATVVSETDIAKLDSIIDGTAAAHKALVVDADKNITGIESLSATSLTGTLETAAQPNVSSVTTLDITAHDGATQGLKLGGALITASGTEVNYVDTTVGAAQASKAVILDSNVSIAGINSLSATNLTGTLQTAAQPKISSVGTLTSLVVAGDVTVGATVISETDIAKIDSITNGTATADKALVLDSGKSIVGISNMASTTIAIGSPADNLLPVEVGSIPYSYMGSYSYTNANNAHGLVDAGSADGTGAYSARFAGRVLCQEIQVTSDRRLKKNIETLELDVAKNFVRNARPVSFNWSEGFGDSNRVVGFIAQELQLQKIPGLVTLAPSPGLAGDIDSDGFVNPQDAKFTVSTDKIIPLLTLTARDTYTQLEKNDAKVAKLEERIAELEHMLLRTCGTKTSPVDQEPEIGFVPLWTQLKTFLSNLLNALKNPVTAIKTLFASLANIRTVLNLANLLSLLKSAPVVIMILAYGVHAIFGLY